MKIEKTMSIPKEHLSNLFGELDRNIKRIEGTLHVDVIYRGDEVHISGEPNCVNAAEKVLTQLLRISMTHAEITAQNVDYALSLTEKELTAFADAAVSVDDLICHTITGKPVKPKTLGQKKYVDAIKNHMIVFGSGPAGTGKTYLAIAMAVTAFQKEEVQRIILTRPAIEAGEKLGFLPGDLQQKIDPYLRPLYDALYQIMGQESFQRNMEKGLIEVAPLAYMRGRTLDNSFIILDEAQNTTPAQMKMFLTRIGFGSKVVITGDASQKDLAPGTKSGLDVARRVLGKVKEIAFIDLTGKDVVRHPLVQKIVNAYEEYEKKNVKRR
ncbi:PhoH family protein [Lachnospiraceae bacterium YH-ros2228]|jgi:phosphate starvation-inducible PhoH-like protein|nr:PhoH family protein [Lachnospiraceae bacterium]MDD6450097.1 PhoH family protein [Lachnospiraceae bacterium]MDD6451466.1 PhoH family protein [Lachnospiraceae bacterium]MDD6578270.1 PhoH family protein [Lachnospiraceae bacterium]